MLDFFHAIVFSSPFEEFDFSVTSADPVNDQRERRSTDRIAKL